MKELNVRTRNNQYEFLLELFGSGLEMKNAYVAPGQWPIYRPVYGLGPTVINDRNGK